MDILDYNFQSKSIQPVSTEYQNMQEIKKVKTSTIAKQQYTEYSKTKQYALDRMKNTIPNVEKH